VPVFYQQASPPEEWDVFCAYPQVAVGPAGAVLRSPAYTLAARTVTWAQEGTLCHRAFTVLSLCLLSAPLVQAQSLNDMYRAMSKALRRTNKVSMTEASPPTNAPAVRRQANSPSYFAANLTQLDLFTASWATMTMPWYTWGRRKARTRDQPHARPCCDPV
jgi:hypothetical protein